MKSTGTENLDLGRKCRLGCFPVKRVSVPLLAAGRAGVLKGAPWAGLGPGHHPEQLSWLVSEGGGSEGSAPSLGPAPGQARLRAGGA